MSQGTAPLRPVVIYDASGIALAVQNGVAIPASTSGLLVAGSDGTNSRFLTVDSNGRTLVVGAGTAGSAVGGVVSVQGVVSGTAISVSQGTGAAAGATWSVELSDGAAFYTGAKTGQFPSALVGGRLDANVGAWLGSTAPTVGSKTSANSVPVVVASDQGTLTVQDSASLVDNAAFTDGTSRVLPGGFILDEVAGTALTENDVAAARIDSKRAQVLVIEDATTRGQRAVVSAANALKVDGSAVTQPVSGTVTAQQATAANLLATVTQGPAAAAGAPWSTELSDGASFYTAAKTGQLPTALVGARLDINNGAWLGSTAPTVGQKAMVSSVPVVIASDQAAFPITNATADTTATGNLNALNAAVQVAMVGQSTVGFQLAAGTLIGTIVPEVSFDGGTTWVTSFFDEPTTSRKDTSIVFASSNVATAKSIFGAGGMSHARVRVSAFTSGTAAITVKATRVFDSSTLNGGEPGAAPPPGAMQVAGTDGTNLRAISVDSSGRQVAVGAGVAGTPTGGVVSVQGVAGGTTLPVTAAQGVAAAANVPWSVELSDGSAFYTAAKSAQFPAALVGGRLDVNIGAGVTLTTKEIRAATSALTSVAASLTNVTLLASNVNRLGATIYNDSATANLFAKLGATASATSRTVRITPNGYYEVPFNYTGIIDGLWDLAVGSARVTELTA